MSSRKKKYSYHQIIKTLSMNENNSMQNKISRLSNRKLAYSKEKDIHNFLYKNKTNITGNQNENNDRNKKSINKFSKVSLRNDNRKIKKIS